MEIIGVIAQWLLNGIFLGCAVLWYRSHRRQQADRERLTASLNVLEARAAKQEQEWAELRAKLQEQLRSLHRIGDEAKALLSQSQLGIAFGETQEERELKALVAHPAPAPAAPQRIPTVEELVGRTLEGGGGRPLDLKTLLNDQLA